MDLAGRLSSCALGVARPRATFPGPGTVGHHAVSGLTSGAMLTITTPAQRSFEYFLYRLAIARTDRVDVHKAGPPPAWTTAAPG